MPATHVAFLRGINLGGKNKLPMKDLAAMFVAEGCTQVRTYIQSGNVVYRATAAIAKRIPARIAERIAEQFGLKVPVVQRTKEELRTAATSNPYLLSGMPENEVHLLFLADLPEPERVQALDPLRSPGDRYQVVARDIYLHLTTGAADTKLTNQYFDSRLKTISTGRNWRTVMTVLAMMDE
jgi:uncharacterized protein (DUF1697 family)